MIARAQDGPGRRGLQAALLGGVCSDSLIRMTLKARVRSGRLVLDEPTDLPEGTAEDFVPRFTTLSMSTTLSYGPCGVHDVSADLVCDSLYFDQSPVRPTSAMSRAARTRQLGRRRLHRGVNDAPLRLASVHTQRHPREVDRKPASLNEQVVACVAYAAFTTHHGEPLKCDGDRP